jgi:hypothetical protein
MQKLETIIGSCLIAIGIGPVIWVILAGSLSPPTSFGPAGLTSHDEGSGSREVVQLIYFWFIISFFFVGIGTWFLIAGLKSKAIVSKTKPN